MWLLLDVTNIINVNSDAVNCDSELGALLALLTLSLAEYLARDIPSRAIWTAKWCWEGLQHIRLVDL